jgi:membrane-associated PAP2 superfamily phosphatase
MKNLEISKKIRAIDILIIINLALVFMALCLINYTNFDLNIQKYFFDFESKKWLIDKNEPVKKFIFYQFPKILFGVILIACLSSAIIGFRRNTFCVRHPELVSGSSTSIAPNFFTKNRHKILLIFFGLAFVPLIVGNIKKFTNVYCPMQLEIYGEKYPYVRIFDHYPADFLQPKKAKCFPAGHSVTGFSLFILFFALTKKRSKIYGLFSGFIFGWILGFYQMAKGAHFFGDTLVSMLLCFLVAALIARLYFNKISYD